MLRRLVAYLLGHVAIEITGGQIERFLNLALAQGIYLWNIERRPDCTRASLPLRDFFALRPVARGARCRVRILRRRGFPFVLVKLRRRPALLVGALACAVFLLWASNHIWLIKVKISGPQSLDPRAVQAVAGEAGLKVGASISQIDLDKVEQHIQRRMGEVSWAVIRVQGTRAVVEVVERPTPQPKDQVGCINLVARKNGVIEELVPFQGEPVVKKGDIVRQGDLLVECAFKYWEGGRPQVLPGTPPPPRSAVARTLVAQAIVRARITYSNYREIPLIQNTEVPTGRTATRWVLKWKDQAIILQGEENPPFQSVRETRKSYGIPGWRNWRAPVELVMITAEEVDVRQAPIETSEAIRQARALLETQLRWRLGPSDKVLTPIKAEVTARGKDFIGVRVSVETLEEIAAPRTGQPLPVPTPPQQPGNSPARP